MRSLGVLALILPLLGGCAAREAPVAPAAAPAATPAPASAPAPSSPAPLSPAPASGAARPPAPAPLIGPVTRTALEEYEAWKTLRAQDYTPDAEAVRAIAANGRDVETLLILATWCPDSKRDVPRYFKILDAAGLGLDRVTMVGVDRTKKDAGGLTERHGVTRVPTFVFFRGGAEIGRVVERPVATLEQDIAAIFVKR